MLNISQFLMRKPGLSLILSFLIVILIGTILLQLPWATFQGISFINALFTATSATTVTGLTVIDTGSDFTTFGKAVILFLIQLGGLGIITGAAFVFLFFKKVGIRGGAGLKIILEEEYTTQVYSTIKFIFKSVFFIEIIGAVLLFFWWRGEFLNTSQLAFSSVFHSISAFCNAGFSFFKNSLENYRAQIFVNILFSSLIIFGGIGYIVLRDIHQKIISFFKKQKRKFTLHSKLVLISTVLLILIGASSFYIFEGSNLSFFSEKELVLASFFQSVTARTAGFSTVNIGELSSPTRLSLMFLMFVGGAPGSTAGGIKVISLALIILGIIALFSRREEVIIFKRSIPSDVVKKVFVNSTILLFIVILFSLSLLYTEKGAFEDILFETFSAFGTVGLSTGLTPHLSFFGKISIITLMFIGRLAPLTLVIFGVKKIIGPKLRFPEEKINLG